MSAFWIRRHRLFEIFVRTAVDEFTGGFFNVRCYPLQKSQFGLFFRCWQRLIESWFLFRFGFRQFPLKLLCERQWLVWLLLINNFRVFYFKFLLRLRVRRAGILELHRKVFKFDGRQLVFNYMDFGSIFGGLSFDHENIVIIIHLNASMMARYIRWS